MKKIGLTGGIATGKSSVLDHWRQRAGASLATIDTDSLAHRCLEPDTATYREVVDAFGDSILNPDGTVNRRGLGKVVFADTQRREQLNAIIHPAVRQVWRNEIERLAATGTTEIAVVAIPLLFEVNVAEEFDRVVAVGCSEPTQRARLAAQGLSDAQAKAQIAAQWPIQEKMDRADYVIWNDGTHRLLERQADLVWSRMKSKIKEADHAPSKN